jgi:phosphoribosylaminoimidazolecarboxamide formyltransferase / IMP cyclohydrolase
MRQIAIFSLTDKKDCEVVARRFLSDGLEIRATGGTFKYLKEKNIECRELSELSREPEIFGGRVKSLHHKILASVLFRPGIDDSQWTEDFRTAAVVCNFYPFSTKGQESKSLREMIEWIDVGGPTMVRAAAKNHEFVWILSDPSQYRFFLEKKGDDAAVRERLGFEAFRKVQELDQEIVETWMTKFRPAVEAQTWPKLQYGENPHQSALYLKKLDGAQVEFLGGFSFNNVRDAEGALRFVGAFDSQNPAVAVVKHQTLCGAAVGLPKSKIDEIFNWAWEGDPVSRYGGILGFNFVPGPAATEILQKSYVEILILPKTAEARSWAEEYRRKKEKVGIVLVDMASLPTKERYDGALGSLTQDRDPAHSRRILADSDSLLMGFGQWTAACSKSNAVTLVSIQNGLAVLVGAGQGQPNRVDSLEALAVPRARRFSKLHPEWKAENWVCFSDAFIPFPDFIEKLGSAGIQKLVQPGGSIRDKEIAEAAERSGIEMKMTGTRHFWH